MVLSSQVETMRTTLFDKQIRNITNTFVENKQQATPSPSIQQLSNAAKGESLSLAVALLQLALFLPLARFVHKHHVLSTDVTISHLVQKNKSLTVRVLMFVVSSINTYKLLDILAIPIAAIFWKMRLRIEAVLTISICLSGTLLRIFLQRLVNRPRPSPLLVDVKKKARGKSFPSGHMVSSVTFWGWLLTLRKFYLREKTWWQKVLFRVPNLFIILTGPSRIYLGDHWPSDVLGGYLLGDSILNLFRWLYVRLKRM